MKVRDLQERLAEFDGDAEVMAHHAFLSIYLDGKAIGQITPVVPSREEKKKPS